MALNYICKRTVMAFVGCVLLPMAVLGQTDNSIFHVPHPNDPKPADATNGPATAPVQTDRPPVTAAPTPVTAAPTPPAAPATEPVAATQPADARLPVPSPADLAQANQEIKEIFEAQLADRSLAARRGLGQKLLDQAESAGSPAEEFALLDQAREIAESAGDAVTAAAADQRISSKFMVDALARKSDMVTELTKTAVESTDRDRTIESGLSVVDDAVAADNYVVALKVLLGLKPLVEKARSPQFSTRYQDKSKLVHDLAVDAAALDAALTVLHKTPNDPAANLTAGRFYCLCKNNWSKGLRFLTKGSDARLKSVALEELAEHGSGGTTAAPVDFARSELKLADGWWDYADTQPLPDRNVFKSHAESLYLACQPGLTGLTALRVQHRLNDAASLAAHLPAQPPDHSRERKIVVRSIVIFADDFVMDEYVNGRKVPQEDRKLIGENFGAQKERVTIDLREGDWIVFNVACNQLRWGGSCYLGAGFLNEDGQVVFTTDATSGNWSVCDDIRDVPQFLADPQFGAEQKAVPPPHPEPSDIVPRNELPDWNGEPIWGHSHNTWLKFTIPFADKAANP